MPKNSQTGTKWITQGTENRKLLPGEEVPVGWILGRTVSEKTLENLDRVRPKPKGVIQTPEVKEKIRVFYERKRLKYIEAWLNGEPVQTHYNSKEYELSVHIKTRLFETRGAKCEECGWAKINLVTGKIPVQIDHVDGDLKNNVPGNLKILCPSCHSLTPTFGILNRGKGRGTLKVK